MGCKHKFKLPFVQRWQCPICNRTVKGFIMVKYELDIHFYNIQKLIFYIRVFYKSDLLISTAVRHIGII